MMKLPNKSQNRSKRLRKKLYLEEYQQIGFELELHFFGDADELLDKLCDYADSQQWSLGIGIKDTVLDGYISGPVQMVNHSTLKVFRKWLEQQQCGDIRLGELHDAYYL